MLRGFWKLTWVEIKIFFREPLGVIGTVGIPVAMFLMFGRAFGSRAAEGGPAARFAGESLPIFIFMMIAIGAALSLATVIAIYREGGILKRLRATPLRPVTILGAHVLVKLLFNGIALALMVAAGRRFYPVTLDVHFISVSLALLVSTLAILPIGFVIASLVPTARFAQPVGSAVLYPMLAVSGLFTPLDSLPKFWATLGGALPITHAVSLMRGAWAGASWLEHLPDLGVLALTMVICVVVSSRVFRWE
jgi:ABC-2 type transport system permease protein